MDIKLKGKVFALDSTTVDLCLEVFITEGSVHDVNGLDFIDIQKGSYYLMDKAYIDFARLYNIKQDKACFVVRGKENIQFRRVSARPVKKNLGIISDQEIILTGINSCEWDPDRLRRNRFYDYEFERTFVFLTNELN